MPFDKTPGPMQPNTSTRPRRNTGENSPRLLQRLVGLETEYAIRFHPHDRGASCRDLPRFYQAFFAALTERTLSVPAVHLKTGRFLANGGAVWCERVRHARDVGLLEGATPECRGARQAVLYQRAQDRLFSEACASLRGMGGEIALIKNDRDGRGNVYGAQENYEVTLAESWSLWLWRLGLVLMIPFLLFTWVALIAVLVVLVGGILAAELVRLSLEPFRLLRNRPLEVNDAPGGFRLSEDDGQLLLPAWFEVLMLWTMRVVMGPLSITMWLLVNLLAFRRIRRRMMAFLISRPVLAGSGTLDKEGRFHLSDKAESLNCLFGFNGLAADRPLFSIGHFLKAIILPGPGELRQFRRFFSPRQRLQLCLGDSNMSEEAEYLRIGATLLVLDAIEAGAIKSAPRVRFPLRNLRRLCGDAELKTAVRLGGQHMTALEIQRFYLDACRDYVNTLEDAPEEARDILRRWEELLGLLETIPGEAVGRIDWVTKRFLLERSGQGLSWEERKKIDLRYHELSDEGYFHRLKATELFSALLTDAEIEQAIRTPPAGTPATARGRYIREFSGGSELTRAYWDAVVVGEGWRRTVLPLHGSAAAGEAERL